jgi:enamine deaminase RidA (YjgF/YER057c/UK114 family)
MIKRVAQTPIMHRFVEHGGVVYFGGVTADDPKASMFVQTQQVARKLDGLLGDAGLDKSRILSATIFITDMALKGEMNRAWTEWLSPDILPTRATIGVNDLGEGLLIEVVIWAGRPL